MEITERKWFYKGVFYRGEIVVVDVFPPNIGPDVGKVHLRYTNRNRVVAFLLDTKEINFILSGVYTSHNAAIELIKTCEAIEEQARKAKYQEQAEKGMLG